MNKDFYNHLPSIVCELLDDEIIPKYQNEMWFKDFWEEYRTHILNSHILEQKMPNSILKNYIKENKCE